MRACRSRRACLGVANDRCGYRDEPDGLIRPFSRRRKFDVWHVHGIAMDSRPVHTGLRHVVGHDGGDDAAIGRANHIALRKGGDRKYSPSPGNRDVPCWLPCCLGAVFAPCERLAGDARMDAPVGADGNDIDQSNRVSGPPDICRCLPTEPI